MEPPDSWDLLTASLVVTDLQRPFAAWAFLVIQGLVRDTPGNREAFADFIREEVERGPITGPSVPYRVARSLEAAGIGLPESLVPDPGGALAAGRLALIAQWSGSILVREQREDLERFRELFGNLSRPTPAGLGQEIEGGESEDLHLQAVECPHCKERLFHDGSIAGRVITCPHCSADLQMAQDPKWHNDPARQVLDEVIALECLIEGQAPVQADGTVCGHPFYFRAKWDSWTFTACVNADIDPSCINPPTDENGFFWDREYRGFYLSAKFPQASTMRYDLAEAIIRDCAHQFLAAL
jgi:hypothetical protein